MAEKRTYPDRITITHTYEDLSTGDSFATLVPIQTGYTAASRKIFKVIGQRLSVVHHPDEAADEYPGIMERLSFGLCQYPQASPERNGLVFVASDPMVPLIDRHEFSRVPTLEDTAWPAQILQKKWPIDTPSVYLSIDNPRICLPFNLSAFIGAVNVISVGGRAFNMAFEHEIFYFEEDVSAELWVELLQTQYTAR